LEFERHYIMIQIIEAHAGKNLQAVRALFEDLK